MESYTKAYQSIDKQIEWLTEKLQVYSERRDSCARIECRSKLEEISFHILTERKNLDVNELTRLHTLNSQCLGLYNLLLERVWEEEEDLGEKEESYNNLFDPKDQK